MVRITPIGVPTCLSRNFLVILFFVVGKNYPTMVNPPWYGGADIGTMPRLLAVGMFCYLISLRSTWLGPSGLLLLCGLSWTDWLTVITKHAHNQVSLQIADFFCEPAYGKAPWEKPDNCVCIV